MSVCVVLPTSVCVVLPRFVCIVLPRSVCVVGVLAEITRHTNQQFFGTPTMGDITISQKSRDIISIVKTSNCRQTEKRRVKFRLELYASVTFLQKNCKTNEFIVLQEAKRRFHDHACVSLRTTNMSASREQYVLAVSSTDDERSAASCKKDS